MRGSEAESLALSIFPVQVLGSLVLVPNGGSPIVLPVHQLGRLLCEGTYFRL